jgi:hypothetical protein
VRAFWAYYDKFTIFQGEVADPFLSTANRFYRYQHVSENRWLWFRKTDKAIQYEQYWDGSQSSWIKYFEGGIVQNNYLFSSDFRIPKCINPFLAMPSLRMADSLFSARPEAAPRIENPPQAYSEVSEVEKWIFENYDADRNGKLSNQEAKELIKDIEEYDFAAEVSIPVSEVDSWFSQWDTNKDGELSVQEFFKAIA